MEKVLTVLLLVGSVYFALLALPCFTLRTPREPIFRTYDRARRLLGFGLLGICADLCLSLWLRHVGEAWMLAAVDLLVAYPVTLALSQMFRVLLTPRQAVGHHLRRGLAGWGVEIMVLVAAWAVDGRLRRWLLVVALIGYVVFLIAVVRQLLREYRCVKVLVDNYYDNQTSRNLRWQRVTTCLFIGQALAALLALILGGQTVMALVSLVYAMATCGYVSISLHNYAHYYPRLTLVLCDAGVHGGRGAVGALGGREVAGVLLTNKQRQALEQWITGKGFLEAGITIVKLAGAIGCNRYYLSHYINSTYAQTFSDWIAGLRIDEAKALMVAHPEWNLENVAMKVGFNSASYFSVSFSKREGTSPARWRRRGNV